MCCQVFNFYSSNKLKSKLNRIDPFDGKPSDNAITLPSPPNIWNYQDISGINANPPLHTT